MYRSANAAAAHRAALRIGTARRQQGSAIVILLVLLSILGIYIAGNVRALRDLKRELKLTEQRQILRLEPVTLPALQSPVLQTNMLEQIRIESERRSVHGAQFDLMQ